MMFQPLTKVGPWPFPRFPSPSLWNEISKIFGSYRQRTQAHLYYFRRVIFWRINTAYLSCLTEHWMGSHEIYDLLNVINVRQCKILQTLIGLEKSEWHCYKVNPSSSILFRISFTLKTHNSFTKEQIKTQWQWWKFIWNYFQHVINYMIILNWFSYITTIGHFDVVSWLESMSR